MAPGEPIFTNETNELDTVDENIEKKEKSKDKQPSEQPAVEVVNDIADEDNSKISNDKADTIEPITNENKDKSDDIVNDNQPNDAVENDGKTNENPDKNNYIVNARSQYQPEVETREKSRLALLLNAIWNSRLMKIIRTAVAHLVMRIDRWAGYKKQNVIPDVLKEAKDNPKNKGKTREELHKEAEERGRNNKELSAEAKKLNAFLDKTFKVALSCDNIEVIPKEYEGNKNVLDVIISKGDNKDIYSLSPDTLGLYVREKDINNKLQQGFGTTGDILNGAYLAFKSNETKIEMDKVSSIIKDKIDNFINDPKQNAFMLGGLLYEIKQKNDNIVLTSYFSKGKSDINTKKAGQVSIPTNKIDTETISKSFNSTFKQSVRDAAEYFTLAIDTNRSDVIATCLSEMDSKQLKQFGLNDIKFNAPKKEHPLTNGNFAIAYQTKYMQQPKEISFDSFGNITNPKDVPPELKQSIEYCVFNIDKTLQNAHRIELSSAENIINSLRNEKTNKNIHSYESPFLKFDIEKIKDKQYLITVENKSNKNTLSVGPLDSINIDSSIAKKLDNSIKDFTQSAEENIRNNIINASSKNNIDNSKPEINHSENHSKENELDQTVIMPETEHSVIEQPVQDNPENIDETIVNISRDSDAIKADNDNDKSDKGDNDIPDIDFDL